LSVADKPQPPTNVELVSFRAGQANVSWSWSGRSVTNKPLARCQFKVLYKQHVADRPSRQNLTVLRARSRWRPLTCGVPFQLFTGKPFALLANLRLAASYNVRVVAVNAERGAESAPSETLNFLAQEGAPRLSLAGAWSPNPRFQFTSSRDSSCAPSPRWRPRARRSPCCAAARATRHPHSSCRWTTAFWCAPFPPHPSTKPNAAFKAQGTGSIRHEIARATGAQSGGQLVCTARNGLHTIRQKTRLLVTCGRLVAHPCHGARLGDELVQSSRWRRATRRGSAPSRTPRRRCSASWAATRSRRCSGGSRAPARAARRAGRPRSCAPTPDASSPSRPATARTLTTPVCRYAPGWRFPHPACPRCSCGASSSPTRAPTSAERVLPTWAAPTPVPLFQVILLGVSHQDLF